MSLVANPLEQLSLTRLRERTSLKWRAYPEDVLPLWVAEMDVSLAEPVRQAVERAIGIGDTGYPSGTAYVEAVAAFARQRWGWHGVDVERALPVVDVMTGVVEMLALVTAPGDAVVVNSPVYPPFYAFVAKLGRQVVEAPLGPDGRLDHDTLERVFSERAAAAYLLCNPHNPTGTVHTVEELTAVAASARTHGVRVVVDEIHAPLVLPGATFVPYLSVPGGENGFSLMAASKGWNLAGLKGALAIAGPEAAADLQRVPEVVSHGCSHLGLIAQSAAYQAGVPWLDALILGLADNRRLLGELLVEQLPDISWVPPQGTYLAWLDCHRLGSADTFLERGRLALVAGEAFGTGGAGHVRLNFATSQAVLTEAIDRMASVR